MCRCSKGRKNVRKVGNSAAKVHTEMICGNFFIRPRRSFPASQKKRLHGMWFHTLSSLRARAITEDFPLDLATE